MAVLALNSTEIANSIAVPPVKNHPIDHMGRLRIARFVLPPVAVAGDIGTTIDLCRLAPGRIRILGALSYVSFSAFGAARTLAIGHRAYEKIDGSEEPQNPNPFVAALDVAAAGQANLAAVNAFDDTYTITSKKGPTIYATVAGGTIPVNAEIRGYIIFVAD